MVGCECVTLLRSGTLTVAFWLSRSPFPTLLFFLVYPSFRTLARQNSFSCFSLSFPSPWVEISFSHEIISQLTKSLRLRPSDASGVTSPLSSQFHTFHIFTLATCLPGVTQLSRFDGCATLLRIPISRVFLSRARGRRNVSRRIHEFIFHYATQRCLCIVQRKLEEVQRSEGSESNKCSLN